MIVQPSITFRPSYKAPSKPRTPAASKPKPAAPQRQQLVPVNLITPTIITQLIPTGAPLISISIPPHDFADPALRYGRELMEYLEYRLPGSTVFWVEGLPLDASPP